jgi:hypothetical protein
MERMYLEADLLRVGQLRARAELYGPACAMSSLLFLWLGKQSARCLVLVDSAVLTAAALSSGYRINWCRVFDLSSSPVGIAAAATVATTINTNADSP